MRERLRLEIEGAVQGVGFRPFVFRLASDLRLDGFVENNPQGLYLEIEGPRESVAAFEQRLESDRPVASVILKQQRTELAPTGTAGFQIRISPASGRRSAVVLPERATCEACRAELLDTNDRRHRYPFTNCTDCGPRFSIVERLPYDRPNTTMASFSMCAACQAEYDDPRDRRFHAQPNACPVCGPRLALWTKLGVEVASADEALRRAAEAIRQGRILATKGLGGYHLVVNARDREAVLRLRQRKQRPAKPLALMVRNLAMAETLVTLDAQARIALSSPTAPILLLPRIIPAVVADNVSPGTSTLGVMLPYTPMHHLLMAELDFPIVATSGNLSDEPICINEHEALDRLGEIADIFLIHDRPITRHVDDSVAWIVEGEVRLLRRARGFAPLPIPAHRELPCVLAVGGEMKNTVALSVGNQVFVSQHIGDLEAFEAQRAFTRVITDFLTLYDATPVAVAHDLHPDYASTVWARTAAAGDDETRERLAGAQRVAVQHHHAHLAACLADNGVGGPALGITWDGTGYGNDGTVWGGEILRGDAGHVDRVATLYPFRLLGGDVAVREPRRVALALLWEAEGEHALERSDLAPVRALSDEERRLFTGMLKSGAHAPSTTSAGRLFDGVAALLGLTQRVSFEGQAAMSLEHEADPRVRDAYPLPITDGALGAPAILDWRQLVQAILEDLSGGASVPRIAARYHNALTQAIVEMAKRVGEPQVALSGGCFQNRMLLARTNERLRQAGFVVLQHRQVPPNDGGLSLGQVMVAAAALERG
jgi:hydrogenase maturation protein HypF